MKISLEGVEVSIPNAESVKEWKQWVAEVVAAEPNTMPYKDVAAYLRELADKVHPESELGGTSDAL